MKKVLQIAEGEVGYRGNNGQSKYFAEMFPNKQYMPWCLAFIEWIFSKAYGEKAAAKMLYMPNGVFTPSVPAMVGFVKKNGMWRVKTARPGWLIFLRTNYEWTNHVELVTGVGYQWIRSIGGNCSGEVRENLYQRNDSRISGYSEIIYPKGD